MTNNKDISTQIQNAIQCFNKGDKVSAQSAFDQIKDLPSDDVGALVQLGSLAYQLGENVAAINIYTRLTDEYPDNAGYLHDLARAYIDSSMLQQAEQLLNKAIEINPEMHSAYINLGYIYILRNNFVDAVEPLKKAVKLKSSDPIAYKNLITALTQSGETEEAYSCAKKLVRLQPKMAEAYHMLGVILKRFGRFDEASTNFEKAIRLNNIFGYSYFDLASSKKFSEADQAFIKKTEKVLLTSMPANDRTSIHFALGKIYNDCKQWDKSFEHYKQANLIGRPAVQDRISYDVFNKTHKSYTKKLFQKIDSIGNTSDVPVFVVGMPRSGTTLIEQIISSHPEGAGAGELTDIETIHSSIFPSDNLNSYKQELNKILTPETIAEHTGTYLNILQQTNEEASKIVNKMPENYLFIGFIHALFPNARFIHAVRSPIDTCLSCYFIPFRSVLWASDLEWIAERYVFYRKAMEYWKSVLPEGVITDVCYEDLVADPETQSKRLIDSIGLEWDPACLEFYKDKRTVETASLWQVRQPIYTSSSKRWLKYAKHIEQLVTGLKDHLTDEDIQELENQGVSMKKKWYSKIFK